MDRFANPIRVGRSPEAEVAPCKLSAGKRICLVSLHLLKGLNRFSKPLLSTTQPPRREGPGQGCEDRSTFSARSTQKCPPCGGHLRRPAFHRVMYMGESDSTVSQRAKICMCLDLRVWRKRCQGKMSPDSILLNTNDNSSFLKDLDFSRKMPLSTGWGCGFRSKGEKALGLNVGRFVAQVDYCQSCLFLAAHLPVDHPERPKSYPRDDAQRDHDPG